MKKILFALFALAVGLQSVSAQSTEPSKKESGGKNYATLGQDDQTAAAGQGTAVGEVAPSLSIFPFQWVDLTDPTKGASAFVPELVDAFYANPSDEAVDLVDISMSFKYFGEKYTKVAIVLNGFLALDSKTFATLIGPNSFNPTGIPSPQLPNNLIAPLWGDLSFVNSSGYVFYRTFKPEKNDKSFDHIVIQWEDAGLYGGYYFYGTSGKVSLTFQVVLFAEGGIMFQYKTIDSGGLRDSFLLDQQYGFFDPTIDLVAAKDYDLIELSNSPLSVGYEDKTGLKGTSWDFGVSSGMTLGNELVPEWASGSASGGFLNLIDGRDRRNNAVTGGGGSGGSCFIGKKKASLDR